jgi:hypothetical protein
LWPLKIWDEHKGHESHGRMATIDTIRRKNETFVEAVESRYFIFERLTSDSRI